MNEWWPRSVAPLALLVARLWSRSGGQMQQGRPILLAGVLLIVGALVAALPWFPGGADWMAAVHALWGGLIMAAGLGLLFIPLRDTHHPVALALVSVYVIAIVHLGVFRAGAHAYDLSEVSDLIARVQAAGHPVANLAAYHGQFHFYGRLVQPLEEQLTPARARAWSRAHPDAYVVAYYRDGMPERPGAVHVQAFRSGGLAVWRGAAFAAGHGALP